ncbi:MAG: hypothetical protein AAFY20_17215 [Cyanobacteria bacterium J06639_14]
MVAACLPAIGFLNAALLVSLALNSDLARCRLKQVLSGVNEGDCSVKSSLWVTG